MKGQQSYTPVSVAYLWHIRVAARSTSSDMTTVFYTRLYGKFIKMTSSFRRKKLHRTNQGFNFLGDSFGNEDNTRAPIQFWRERESQHIESWFFLRKDPSIFISIAPELLDRSKETSWVCPASPLKSTNHFLA